MYCSSCGEKQNEDAKFSSNCGNRLTNESNTMNNSTQLQKKLSLPQIKNTRKQFITFFIVIYICLFIDSVYSLYDPNYYVLPPNTFNVLAILSAITFAVFSYKLTTQLGKKTYVIVIYTILSPFFLINAIPFIGLLADSRKFINTVS